MDCCFHCLHPPTQLHGAQYYVVTVSYHDYDCAGGDEHDDDEEERHPDGVSLGHDVAGAVIRAS